MDKKLVCWKCGASIGDLPLPLARQAECRMCHSHLHSCKQCEFFDPQRANQCREPVAEFVQDKERANFCGYFRPGTNACTPGDSTRSRSTPADLDALFGLASDTQEGAESVSAAERSRKKLEELFKK